MKAESSDSAMPSCDQMTVPPDPSSPNLCAEHCHHGEQSARFHAPAVPAVALVSLYAVFSAGVEVPPPMSATARSVHDVAMAPPPPHTILHCCIRD